MSNMRQAQHLGINRRQALAACGVVSSVGSLAFAQPSVPRHILLRSSWQTVNVGDIAHTPGLLRLLENHLPEVKGRSGRAW